MSNVIETWYIVIHVIPLLFAILLVTFFFFFLINNLLHGAQGQTVVATFVTTYIRRTLTWSRRKEKEKGKRKEKEQIEKGERKKKPNTIEI